MSDYGRRSTLNRLQKAASQGYGPLAPGRSFVVNGNGRTTSPPGLRSRGQPAALADRPPTLQVEVRRTSQSSSLGPGSTVASTLGARSPAELSSAERQRELAAKVTQQLEIMKELKTKQPKDDADPGAAAAASPAARARSRSASPAAAEPLRSDNAKGADIAADDVHDEASTRRRKRRRERREEREDGDGRGDDASPRERRRRSYQDEPGGRTRRSSV
mmetsp:Transcript_44537/g.81338  ORF Transcript_44537/g.81338 Transcript_44537/m.81338 type:complete len:218 (-) Transcript_44537:97-750(-)